LNQNPEQLARDKICIALEQYGWVILKKNLPGSTSILSIKKPQFEERSIVSTQKGSIGFYQIYLLQTLRIIDP